MRTRLLTVLAPVVVAALLLSGCSGGGDKESTSSSDLEARLLTAKKAIDGAASLQVSISTDKVPDGVSGLKSATGVGTHAPAFKGKVSVVSGGSSISADVIATDGKVWAKLGFSPAYLTISPKTLNAPDPATLVGTEGDGLAVILANTAGTEQGDRSRDGKAVLTTITGTIKGSVIQQFLPTADDAGSFTVSYRLDDDDLLRDATIKGPFYEGSPDVTYRVKLAPSDESVSIDPPKSAGGA
ncbi:hypothetical protein ASD11_07730 [Aeromicrobium sp. Root495]|uniref:LppX_LprAFG lipoprotein n=1 Tax=Aeromicrobium sp. Root495 TaxID=1736550 RepID=UPI0006F2DF75|nr:LppX_LprAFG lipoprotein [Aeromicrobium sp. Root495]KQY59445.1 hypothetical protein ASD11_07730 [Aeromicrobium sp. Root495]